jgi:hypothetical protein
VNLLDVETSVLQDDIMMIGCQNELIYFVGGIFFYGKSIFNGKLVVFYFYDNDTSYND